MQRMCLSLVLLAARSIAWCFVLAAGGPAAAVHTQASVRATHCCACARARMSWRAFGCLSARRRLCGCGGEASCHIHPKVFTQRLCRSVPAAFVFRTLPTLGYSGVLSRGCRVQSAQVCCSADGPIGKTMRTLRALYVPFFTQHGPLRTPFREIRNLFLRNTYPCALRYATGTRRRSHCACTSTTAPSSCRCAYTPHGMPCRKGFRVGVGYGVAWAGCSNSPRKEARPVPPPGDVLKNTKYNGQSPGVDTPGFRVATP